MKAIVSIMSLSAAALLLNTPVLRSQDTASGKEGVSEAQKAVQLAQDEAAKAEAQDAQAKAQKAQAEAQADFAKAQERLARAQADMAQADPFVSGGGFGGNNVARRPAYTQRLQNIVKRAPDDGVGGALVIRSSESDPKEQAKLEEDLAVMSHILEKAVSERGGGHGGLAWGGTAMGIDVLYSPAARPLHTLYLEEYGALFLLNVGFPLLPPPQAEEQQEKTETTSDWEEAKEELYGQGNTVRVLAQPSEPYDKERVNRLRDGLLDSLKNATNIRDLKPDDSITVCVFGGPSSGQAKARAYANRGRVDPTRYGLGASGPTGAPMRQTIMTIRVKKSDADAFAKGAITLEAFRKRAHIVSYAGSPETGIFYGGSGSGMPMGGIGGGGGMGGIGFGGGEVK